MTFPKRNHQPASTNTGTSRFTDVHGWTKVFEEGILYYKRPGSDIRHNHPCYDNLLADMAQFKKIRFPSHRIAFQLNMLQKRIQFDGVAFYHVVAAFNSPNFRASFNDKLINVAKIDVILDGIYKATYGDIPHFDGNQNYFKDVALNFIINAYDHGRSGNVEVLSLKVILVLLCNNENITVDSKFVYLYNQIANHNNSVSRKRIAHLLKDIAIVAEYFREEIAYGIQTVAYAVESCFKEVNANMPLTEVQFLKWLAKKPQSLVWYYTFHRMGKAEKMVHNVRCKSCKRKPFTGYRYRCTQCLNTTFCQECYLYDGTSRIHHNSHPVREFCDEVTVKEKRKVIGNIIWNNVKTSQACSGLQIPCLRYATTKPNHSTGSLLQDSLLHMTPSSVVTFVRPSHAHNTSFDGLSRTSAGSPNGIEPVVVDLSKTGSSLVVNGVCGEAKNIDVILDHLEEDHRELRRILETKSEISAGVVQQQFDALSIEISRMRACVRNSTRTPRNGRNVSVASNVINVTIPPRHESSPMQMKNLPHIATTTPSAFSSNPTARPVNSISSLVSVRSPERSPRSRSLCSFASRLSSISEHSPPRPANNKMSVAVSQPLDDLYLSPISIHGLHAASANCMRSRGLPQFQSSTPKCCATSLNKDCSKATNYHEDSSGLYMGLVLQGLDDLTDIDLDNELGLNLSSICVNKYTDADVIATQKQLNAELSTICFQLQEGNNDDHPETRFLAEMYCGIEALEKICYILLSEDLKRPL